MGFLLLIIQTISFAMSVELMTGRCAIFVMVPPTPGKGFSFFVPSVLPLYILSLNHFLFLFSLVLIRKVDLWCFISYNTFSLIDWSIEPYI